MVLVFMFLFLESLNNWNSMNISINNVWESTHAIFDHTHNSHLSNDLCGFNECNESSFWREKKIKSKFNRDIISIMWIKKNKTKKTRKRSNGKSYKMLVFRSFIDEWSNVWALNFWTKKFLQAAIPHKSPTIRYTHLHIVIWYSGMNFNKIKDIVNAR